MRAKAPPWWFVVGPALTVALPLLAVGFQGDERRDVYFNAERFGTNPVPVLRQVVDELDVFLNAGNLRPLGRFIAYAQQTYLFETAEATGLAPHVTQGVVRCVGLGFFAWVFTRLVNRFSPSGGGDTLAAWIAPPLLAVVLVASGVEHPIIHFPVLFILSASALLGATMVAANPILLDARREGWMKLGLLAVLGACSAMTFDLLYLVPGFAAIGLLAQAAVHGRAVLSLRGSAGAWRVLSIAGGFALVFVPSRIVIASRCAEHRCYSGSEPRLDADLFPVAFDRFLSGTPMAAWRHVDGSGTRAGGSLPAESLVTNSFLLTLVAVLFCLSVFAARRLKPAQESHAPRQAVALASIGAALVVFPAVLVSASRLVQRGDYAVGEGWRDSLLTASGWAMLGLSAVVALQGRTNRVTGSRLGRIGVVVLLFVGLSATLLANARAANVDDADPESAVAQAVSSSLVPFDPSESANEIRCELAHRYREIRPDSTKWISAEQIIANLDLLVIERHGVPYCR